MAKVEEVSSLLTVKISEAIQSVILSIKAKKVAMIHGSPAIGKSSIVHQIAELFNLKMIDMRLAQCDPTDLNGFPHFDEKTGRACYVPMDTFPLEDDALPAKADGTSYAGWLLFFDEFNSASVAVQAAAYKIVLDRMVGKHKLHKNVAIVCAGNLETDGAIVEAMSTALQSRIVHFNLEVDALEWISWASKAGIDHRITSFISYKPGMLYTFEPEHSERTYASPRTWQFADDFLKMADLKDPAMLSCLSGSLSQGVAREFMLFCDIFANLPTIADIITAPTQIRVSNEPSILYAMVGSMSHHANKENLTKLMQYVVRLPIEFQVVFMRMALNRNKALLENADIQEWVGKNADEMF